MLATSALRSALQEINDQFYIVIVREESLLSQVYQLRYQVYCTEKGFESGLNGLEYDEYDSRSRHIALVSRNTREVVGTARLVLPTLDSLNGSFPMQQVCDPSLFDQIPLETSVEISRFAISKQRRSVTCASLMRMGLIQGLVRLSAELGVTHWCAIMEPRLLRLLRMTSIYFHPLGSLVEYHGLRQPCYNKLGSLLDGVMAEQPVIWDYLTEGAKIWRREANGLVAA